MSTASVVEAQDKSSHHLHGAHSSSTPKRKQQQDNAKNDEDAWVCVGSTEKQQQRDPLLGHLILEDYFNVPPAAPPPPPPSTSLVHLDDIESDDEEDSLFSPTFLQQQQQQQQQNGGSEEEEDSSDGEESFHHSYDHCNYSLGSQSPLHSPRENLSVQTMEHWLENEQVLVSLPKVLFQPDNLHGALVISTYRICFTPDDGYVASWRLPTHFEFPLANVSRATPLAANCLGLHCRDGRQDLTFRLPDNKAVSAVCRWLADMDDNVPVAFDKRRMDLARLRAAIDPPLNVPGMRETFVNARFEWISSYPPSFLVPSCITDDKVIRITKFRCEQRIPALSWASPASAGLGTIWRCAQPMVGLFFNNSLDDEDLVAAIGKSVLIVDCRGFGAVVGNQLSNKGGTESAWRYPRSETYFAQIGNMNEIRKLFRHLTEYLNSCRSGGAAANGNGSNLQQQQQQQQGHLKQRSQQQSLAMDMSASMLASFQDEEPSTLATAPSVVQWIIRLRTLLSTAVRVAETVLANRGVVVHCTHGWDRTPQVVCLAQLLVDPERRTVRGFVQMVHREWVLFGHQFSQRVLGRKEAEKSPIFLQFLDCVWQLVRMFPQWFEFNSTLLECLAHHTTSKRFIEFLGHGAKDWEAGIRGGGASLWDLVLFDARSSTEFYEPRYSSANTQQELVPPPAMLAKRLELWDFYLRHGATACHAQHAFVKQCKWAWWM